MLELLMPAAVALIKNGGVLAYPTEAVYGLGCDPLQGSAVTRICQLKDRPNGQGFILIASDWQQVANWVQPIDQNRLAEILASWPGHFTWIFPASDQAPISCIGPENTIAIRITAHPQVVTLCEQLGCALISTSANPHGAPPARSAEQVWEYFHTKIDGILQGELSGHAQPSQIRNAITGQLIR